MISAAQLKDLRRKVAKTLTDEFGDHVGNRFIELFNAELRKMFMDEAERGVDRILGPVIN